ncbi:uncharacterized protein LOC6567573 [Drosophila grimshawi]|uniref:GH21735 n=1 Tax=Drosophila grimshawi TaxID=7222 RepID=B4JRZ2_DROGR|nr:uncharacterized protein LOC6567573 [Drosophila grimshawi]EDV94532.1 GH21735 [Drosophila grimshawi]
MSCDESTALLSTRKQIQTQQQQLQQGHHQEAHIIVVPLGKDPKDYEPIFTTADYSYGLSLEELLPFGRDPWWQKVRRLCFGCLWLTFTLTLLASLYLAYFHDDAIICRQNKLMIATTVPPPLALVSNVTLLMAAT